MSSDIAKLQERSASPPELVLVFDDALVALNELQKHGARVLGWEGWLRYPDGRLGHSEQHQGTADLSDLELTKAFELCRRTMREAHDIFEAAGEGSAQDLLFCIQHDV